MKNAIRNLCLISLVLAFGILPARMMGESSDTVVSIESKLALSYLCMGDSVKLTASLNIRKGDMPLALQNAMIHFSATNGEQSTDLGSAKTDQEGNAVCTFHVSGLPADPGGMVSYTAAFKGKEPYPAAESSVTAKPAFLRITFSVEDSVRTLMVKAGTKDSRGDIVAIPGETVLIYVPRLFSLLKVGEVTLDETGYGTMEFPKDIIGDSIGNLNILARIEEHDIYGFAQGTSGINWGVPKQFFKAEVFSRELWTPIAPLWMIITLIIMLAGVWAHYAYAVYELIMIRRLGKKTKQPWEAP